MSDNLVPNVILKINEKILEINLLIMLLSSLESLSRFEAIIAENLSSKQRTSLRNSSE